MTLTFRVTLRNRSHDHSIRHRPFPICFFFGKTHRLATIHTLQTDNRRTQHCSVSETPCSGGMECVYHSPHIIFHIFQASGPAMSRLLFPSPWYFCQLTVTLCHLLRAKRVRSVGPRLHYNVYMTWYSLMEVYHDYVIDLLSVGTTLRSPLTVSEHPVTGPFVQGT